MSRALVRVYPLDKESLTISALYEQKFMSMGVLLEKPNTKFFKTQKNDKGI